MFQSGPGVAGTLEPCLPAVSPFVLRLFSTCGSQMLSPCYPTCSLPIASWMFPSCSPNVFQIQLQIVTQLFANCLPQFPALSQNQCMFPTVSQLCRSFFRLSPVCFPLFSHLSFRCCLPLVVHGLTSCKCSFPIVSQFCLSVPGMVPQLSPICLPIVLPTFGSTSGENGALFPGLKNRNRNLGSTLEHWNLG